MTRAVLDANKYVSALLKPHSNHAGIARLAYEGNLTWLLSPAILDELERMLIYPKIIRLHRRARKKSNSFCGSWRRLRS